MKIYRIEFDVDNFQSFLPDDQNIWAGSSLLFDCKAKRREWRPPSVYVADVLSRTPDFYYLGPGAMIATPPAFGVVNSLFERSGEVLSLPFQGEEFKLLNVTACVNCLDLERTEFLMAGTERGAPTKYVFRADRVQEYPVFKVPEDRFVDMFCPEWSVDPQDEFKAAVEELGLTGLIFKLVWEG